MTIFALALASNVEPQRHLRQALTVLATVGQCRLSPIYQIPCRDGIGADYYNMAVLLTCAADVGTITQLAKQLEQDSGRQRPSHTIPLDIDVIAWGENLTAMQFNPKKLPLAADVVIPMREIWENFNENYPVPLPDLLQDLLQNLSRDLTEYPTVQL